MTSYDKDPFYLRYVNGYTHLTLRYSSTPQLLVRYPNERSVTRGAYANTARAIQVNMDTSSSSSSTRTDVCDTRTTRTTVMTRSSGKRVRIIIPHALDVAVDSNFIVWVGPLVVKELKRIVESSEITKYVIWMLDEKGRMLTAA